MSKLMMYICLILWIIYYILLNKREYLRNKEQTKSGIFHLIRFDFILYLVIYIIYSLTLREYILPYLYLAIMLTGIVYVSYDLKDNYKKVKTIPETTSILLYLLVSIIILLISIYFIITNNFKVFSYITLICIFLTPINNYIIFKLIFKKKN
jgi:hypothetical protein